jgi:hypothetical protein
MPSEFSRSPNNGFAGDCTAHTTPTHLPWLPRSQDRGFVKESDPDPVHSACCEAFPQSRDRGFVEAAVYDQQIRPLDQVSAAAHLRFRSNAVAINQAVHRHILKRDLAARPTGPTRGAR